jgi:hypothetical protein
MKYLKQFVDFYINSSIHVAIAVFAFMQVTSLHLNNPITENVDGIVFLGTIVGYNFLKYDLLRNPKLLFSKFLFSPIFIFTFLCFLGLIYLFLGLRTNYQILFIVPFATTLLYPFFRKYGLLKIFIVAFCITFAVVEIPVLEVSISRNEVFLFEIKLFFILLALLIPFEIYDSQFDEEKLQTIPQKYGFVKAKIIGILFLVLSFFNFKSEMQNNLNVFIADMVIALLIIVFILFSSVKRSKYYTIFWVESVPIFWVMLIGLFKMLSYLIPHFGL